MKNNRGYLRILAVFLMLLAGEGRGERDPFQPPGAACGGEKPPFRWQLKGIVGRAGDYHAWLMRGRGKWLQLRQGEGVVSGWRLRQIDGLSITLADVNGCLPPLKKTLKGSIYEKDTLPGAVAERADAFSGEEGAAVAGF
ncbi:HofP DNA utilization family protein [Erwinia typographi]|uniref:HofP DNA utilization family protein n=1 Tax=Erwinia typographi TaxID=371042 RepID=UPI00068BADD3|nr:HofP DNA utilization family protein [Erwinia typographi]